MLDFHWILTDDGHVPVAVDLITWAYWMEEHRNRAVHQTICAAGTSFVSTMFLGIDMRYWGDGPPILFETMVFGGAADGFQDRHCTWREASLHHDLVVGQVEEIPLWKHAVANVRADLKNWWKALYYEVKSWYSDDPFVLACARSLTRRR